MQPTPPSRATGQRKLGRLDFLRPGRGVHSRPGSVISAGSSLRLPTVALPPCCEGRARPPPATGRAQSTWGHWAPAPKGLARVVQPSMEASRAGQQLGLGPEGGGPQASGEGQAAALTRSPPTCCLELRGARSGSGVRRAPWGSWPPDWQTEADVGGRGAATLVWRQNRTCYPALRPPGHLSEDACRSVTQGGPRALKGTGEGWGGGSDPQALGTERGMAGSPELHLPWMLGHELGVRDGCPGCTAKGVAQPSGHLSTQRQICPPSCPAHKALSVLVGGRSIWNALPGRWSRRK